VRPISQTERRLAEAAKMGFTTAYLAERSVPNRARSDIRAVGVSTIGDLFERLFA
jgi:DNA repair protein RadA/Sms